MSLFYLVFMTILNQFVKNVTKLNARTLNIWVSPIASHFMTTWKNPHRRLVRLQCSMVNSYVFLGERVFWVEVNDFISSWICLLLCFDRSSLFEHTWFL